MKKVLVISTSLRANSNSDYIAKEFAKLGIKNKTRRKKNGKD